MVAGVNGQDILPAQKIAELDIKQNTALVTIQLPMEGEVIARGPHQGLQAVTLTHVVCLLNIQF